MLQFYYIHIMRGWTDMGSRIAAVSVRTGCAMTVFTRGAMVFLAVRRGGALPRPQATAEVAPTKRQGMRCKPGFGSSGRPTPTRRLPVKSRRGRCPHRPGGTSPQKIRRAACPHAAARQAQRFPPSRQASTSAERVADGDAEAIRKQGANLHIPVRVAEGAGTVVTSVAERIPKPLVLAAFFPPFLSPQKEREPRSAQRSAEYYGLPHQ